MTRHGRVQRRRWRNSSPRAASRCCRPPRTAPDDPARIRLRARASVLQQRICLRDDRRRGGARRALARSCSMPRSRRRRPCRRCGSRWSAAYFPLHDLAGADALLARAWPDPVDRACSTRQMREPREEAALRDTIPQLTPIEDAISRAVRAQYEANPYPRWVRHRGAAARSPASRPSCARCFPPLRSRASAKSGSPDILIAGCGTGQHAIMTARQYGARMLAIDLSRASLAYAAARTRALGLDIEYAQADIMRLGTLGRTLRSDRVERRAAPHGRPLGGMARAALAAAPRRLHADRPLQRDRALGRGRGARVHRAGRVMARHRPRSGASATT